MSRHRILFFTGTMLAGLLLHNVAFAVPVTDGLSLWLDAGDAGTVFQDVGMTTAAVGGDPVALWLDKSGNDFHARQPDAGLTPVYSPTGMNGAPTLSFSGTDGDGMLIDEGLSLARPYTVFIANQYTGDVRGRTLQGLDSNWLHGLWNGSISSFAGDFVGGNPAADVNTVYVADTTGTDAGESSLYVNGLEMTTNAAPTGAPGRLGIGSGGQFPEVSDADVSEIVVYNRVLGAEELSSVRDFLYGKYNPTILAPPNPTNTVFNGQIGVFTGGDAGEGLDLDGEFAYAINVGGPAANVGGVGFTDGSIAGMESGSSAGAVITVANELGEWHAPSYGDSAADDGLETVMSSIRWNNPPGVNIDLDVVAGTEYKLQVMFAENCCDRGFDISVEGEVLVDNFNVQATQEGIANTAQGAMFSYTFTASDDQVNILLGGANPLATDNNPIASGLTLEVVPEPSSVMLSLLGMTGLLGLRRRR